MPTVAEQVSQHCLDLFDQRAQSDIDRRFGAYMRENPAAWTLFMRFVNELRAAGCERGSASAIVERLRWETAIQTKSSDGFKISDHFTSRLSRRAIAEHPEPESFFEVRKLRAG